MEAMVDTAMVAMEDMEAMVIMAMARDQQLLAMDMEVMEAMADMVMAATVDMEAMDIMVMARDQQLLAMAMEDMEAMADMVMVVMEDMEDMAIMVMARDLLSLATDIMVGMEDTEVTAMEAMVMAMAMANEPMSPFDAATMLQKLEKKSTCKLCATNVLEEILAAQNLHGATSFILNPFFHIFRKFYASVLYWPVLRELPMTCKYKDISI